jgi:3-polyprenyl-4-hydroxybenzoate decarboxylase
MKKLFVAAFALSLTSCALWDAYFMAPYDANEYMLITEIRTTAIQYRRQCENPVMAPVNAQAMANRTELYEKY